MAPKGLIFAGGLSNFAPFDGTNPPGPFPNRVQLLMKLTTQIVAGLASLGLLVAASAEDAVKFNVPGVNAPAKAAPAASTPAKPAAAPASAPAAAPAVKYTDEQLMEAYGYIFMLETRMAVQLQALEMTPAHKAAMIRGITSAVNGAELPYEPQQVQQQLQEFMSKRQAAFLGKIKAAQIAASSDLFAKLKDNKNVVIAPSGLGYEIVAAGKGAVPKPGQLVSINYTGALATGQVFDSNEGRGPAEFLLQSATPQSPQGVIAGMFEGLQKTGVGGKVKLYIPAALGYGDDGAPGAIPPGAALVFDVEIVGVKDAPKDAAK